MDSPTAVKSLLLTHTTEYLSETIFGFFRLMVVRAVFSFVVIIIIMFVYPYRLDRTKSVKIDLEC